ncbi:MAG: aldo/keto reductase [Actinomycetota bacterium]
MYLADGRRYEQMTYRRCGTSGLDLPLVSLGLWQNFGRATPLETQREIVLAAFDAGITHIDLANNYGPPPGSAEQAFGDLLHSDLAPYRDELIVSTKAGYRMWPGPYGEWGSRKYLRASLEASLRRLRTDYVDIFYSHRLDPSTPLRETLGALKYAVDSGKALYAGISSYPAVETSAALDLAAEMELDLLIHQPSYSMFNRWIERGEPSLLDVLGEREMGTIVFSPLAQGLLTSKYLDGVPADSRAARDGSFKQSFLSDETRERLRELNRIAESRGQTLAQMAIAWVLRDPRITSALIGASSVAQLCDSLGALENLAFTAEELAEIDVAAVDAGVNIWEPRHP